VPKLGHANLSCGPQPVCIPVCIIVCQITKTIKSHPWRDGKQSGCDRA
jgi:hypothetical protein